MRKCIKSENMKFKVSHVAYALIYCGSRGERESHRSRG